MLRAALLLVLVVGCSSSSTTTAPPADAQPQCIGTCCRHPVSDATCAKELGPPVAWSCTGKTIEPDGTAADVAGNTRCVAIDPMPAGASVFCCKQ